MGIQRGSNALYTDPFAAITWFRQTARSPMQPDLLLTADALRRLVSEVLLPDATPRALEIHPSWAVVADGRLIYWNGGKADAP
jgi:hypothetical protein